MFPVVNREGVNRAERPLNWVYACPAGCRLQHDGLIERLAGRVPVSGQDVVVRVRLTDQLGQPGGGADVAGSAPVESPVESPCQPKPVFRLLSSAKRRP
jgi:hypothetical protein